jgi:endonuclease/exonuclease/phosphatase family metal-dependent hydrolase
MTANLRLGTSDAVALADMAKIHADVLALQEVTPQQLLRMQSAGVGSVFTNGVLHPVPWSSIGLWSRYPIEYSRLLPGYALSSTEARMTVPGAEEPVTVMVVHLTNLLPRSIDL